MENNCELKISPNCLKVKTNENKKEFYRKSCKKCREYKKTNDKVEIFCNIKLSPKCLNKKTKENNKSFYRGGCNQCREYKKMKLYAKEMDEQYALDENKPIVFTENDEKITNIFPEVLWKYIILEYLTTDELEEMMKMNEFFNEKCKKILDDRAKSFFKNKYADRRMYSIYMKILKEKGREKLNLTRVRQYIPEEIINKLKYESKMNIRSRIEMKLYDLKTVINECITYYEGYDKYLENVMIKKNKKDIKKEKKRKDEEERKKMLDDINQMIKEIREKEIKKQEMMELNNWTEEHRKNGKLINKLMQEIRGYKRVNIRNSNRWKKLMNEIREFKFETFY